LRFGSISVSRALGTGKDGCVSDRDFSQAGRAGEGKAGEGKRAGYVDKLTFIA
jgi:hypothetical protein